MQERPNIIVAPATIKLARVAADLSNYSLTVQTPSNIVLHATDGCEGTNADINTAAEIARPLPPGKKKSYHYCCDADSATLCVTPGRTAWHAGHHGNAIGIGIEICGSAKQTRAEWLDATSLATLGIAARLCAQLCRDWTIPAELVDARGLLAGARGITTHAFVSQAWHESDHYDPGAGFPLAEFIEAVRVALAGELARGGAV